MSAAEPAFPHASVAVSCVTYFLLFAMNFTAVVEKQCHVNLSSDNGNLVSGEQFLQFLQDITVVSISGVPATDCIPIAGIVTQQRHFLTGQ